MFPVGQGFMSPDRLAAISMRPQLPAIQAGLQKIADELDAISAGLGRAINLHVGIVDADLFDAVSTRIGEDEYVLGLPSGLILRLAAAFRRLALTNAFGKYSPRDLDRERLSELLALPDLDGFREDEPRVPADALLEGEAAGQPDSRDLRDAAGRPPVDARHAFDIETLVTAAVMFAFWHELAHVVYGHIDWQHDHIEQPILLGVEPTKEQEAERRRLRRIDQGIEHIADEFAARRIAADILQATLVERNRYVLGPFWLDRRAFAHFGKDDGLPGESIQADLDGFLYRVAFALIGLIVQFSRFPTDPVKSHLWGHPHPEVRLSRIADVVWDQLGGNSQPAPGSPPILAQRWSTAFGYALHTAEIALLTCGARNLPIGRDALWVGGMFHLHEIQARVKAAHTSIQAAREATQTYGHVSLLSVVEPHPKAFSPLPCDRDDLIELAGETRATVSGSSGRRNRERGDLMSKATEAQQLVQQAKQHMLADRLEPALECMNQALAIHRQLGDRHNEAANLHNLGMLYTMMGDLNKALASYREALTIATELRFDDLAKAIDHNLDTIIASLRQ